MERTSSSICFSGDLYYIIPRSGLQACPEYRTTPYLADYLKNLRDTFKKKEEKIIRVNDIEQFTNNSNNIKVDVNLYNLFLFIFIGIIIILLCDQITRLAIIIAKKSI